MPDEVGASVPDIQCYICWDSDENFGKYEHKPYELPCKHAFGRSCIARWAEKHTTCPACRGEFPADLFSKVTQVDPVLIGSPGFRGRSVRIVQAESTIMRLNNEQPEHSRSIADRRVMSATPTGGLFRLSNNVSP